MSINRLPERISNSTVRNKRLQRDIRPARHNVGFLLHYADRAFTRALAEELKSHDSAISRWSVLRVLSEEEGISQVELADRMVVEKANLTAVLEAMVAEGLLVRPRDTRDKRKSKLFLTARARELKKELVPVVKSVNAEATHGMDDLAIRQFCELLMQLIANLESDSPLAARAIAQNIDLKK
ncbi:MAG: MarR family winged helix-turn-helix transcriptional regulator [Xanthobacteraceae bacterium]